MVEGTTFCDFRFQGICNFPMVSDIVLSYQLLADIADFPSDFTDPRPTISTDADHRCLCQGSLIILDLTRISSGLARYGVIQHLSIPDLDYLLQYWAPVHD